FVGMALRPVAAIPSGHGWHWRFSSQCSGPHLNFHDGGRSSLGGAGVIASGEMSEAPKAPAVPGTFGHHSIVVGNVWWLILQASSLSKTRQRGERRGKPRALAHCKRLAQEDKTEESRHHESHLRDGHNHARLPALQALRKKDERDHKQHRGD